MENSRDSAASTDNVRPHVTEQGRVGEPAEDTARVDDEYDDNYDVPAEFLHDSNNQVGDPDNRHKYHPDTDHANE